MTAAIVCNPAGRTAGLVILESVVRNSEEIQVFPLCFWWIRSEAEGGSTDA